MVLHVDDSPEVLEFVNGRDSRALASVGAACPDHLVSTKVVPYFSAWSGGSADALRDDLVQGAAAYARRRRSTSSASAGRRTRWTTPIRAWS